MFAHNLLSALLVTSTAAYPHLRYRNTSIPFGEVIYSCTEPDTFALTFDDGPFTYTEHILDLLSEAGMKATFFMNGNNWANIYDHNSTVERMISEGHQIGSHTYSHSDLATVDVNTVITEMTHLESALLSIVGKFPTYMRPPYFSYTEETLEILGELGYHVIQADVDTLDWSYNTLGNTTSISLFEEGLASGGTISLAHDVHKNTAETLVPLFIEVIKEKNLKAVPVGECLGDNKANWYSTTRNSTSTTTETPTSTGTAFTGTATPTGIVDAENGSCGGKSGYVCEAGLCCSEHGYCGSTSSYCRAGCQDAFGVCA